MLNYRPDIDGLRAIAVGSVVLYHLDKNLLSGGFVGVDIFFVISGYLITKLIYKELATTGDFSFSNFYLRRVRRLFPALFATLAACLLASYALFSPAFVVEFGKSLVAAIFSVSNFFFWSSSGYFDTQSAFKPLLHTWSLSIEEQFYLIWPALMVFLFSRKTNGLIPLFIGLMAVVSLGLNEWFFANQTTLNAWFGSGTDQSSFDVASTVFYLLPFRVFEFAIGAILVWLDGTRYQRRYLGELSFAIGLAMVCYAITQFTDATQFPSTAALIPCVGAALMIFSGGTHRLAFIVDNRLLVGLGLISYSLYLVHWPLIVFYQYWNYVPLTPAEMSALVALSVILAYLMYRFIEQPFRRPKPAVAGTRPNRPFVLTAVVSTALIVVISSTAFASGGWLWRYPTEVLQQLKYQQGDYTEYFWNNVNRLADGFKDNGKPKVLIIGDSMAAGFSNALVAADAEQQLDIATIPIGHNCKAIFPLSNDQYQVIYGGAKEVCRAEHQKVLDKERLLKQADSIILASYWWEIPRLQYVPSTVAYLRSVSTAKVMVLGLKDQQSNGIWFLNKHSFSAQIHKIRTPLNAHAQAVNQLLKKSADDYHYFDLVDLFCDQRGCQRVTEDGYVIIFDGSHLSENGADFVAKNLPQTDWYKSLLSRKKAD